MLPAAANWSGLHIDILHEIVHRITSPADLVRFSAVCRRWRSVSLHHHRHCQDCTSKSRIPWVEVPSEQDQYRIFYSLTEQKTYRFHLPQMTGHRIIGSSSSCSTGFLISLDEDTVDLHVVNPLSRSCIPLPPTSTLEGIVGINRDSSSGRIDSYIVGRSKTLREIFIKERDVSGIPISYTIEIAPSDFARTLDLGQMQHECFQRAIIILSPSTSDVAMVVVTHRSGERLAFARPGDASWTAIRCPDDHRYNDIIFHNSRLYALCSKFHASTEMLDIFDLSCPSDGPAILDNGPSFQEECEAWGSHLVESSDGKDLFLVKWKFGIYETIGFVVYKLDESSGQWDVIRSLDGLVLFMGPNSSIAVAAPSCLALNGGCICFLQNFEDVGGIGVFTLEDGSVKRLNLNIDLQKLCWPMPVWFIPSLF